MLHNSVKGICIDRIQTLLIVTSMYKYLMRIGVQWAHLLLLFQISIETIEMFFWVSLKYSWKWNVNKVISDLVLKCYDEQSYFILEHYIICYIKYSFGSCISHLPAIYICKSFVVCWIFGHYPSDSCHLGRVPPFAVAVTCPPHIFGSVGHFPPPCFKNVKIFNCWINIEKKSNKILRKVKTFKLKVIFFM
jgi:hypothetical protein